MDEQVRRLLERTGAVSRRQHPDLARRLSRWADRGDLAAVLPGVYAPPHRAGDLRVRVAAACLFDPTAVIVGDAAAALTFWPELVPELVEVAGRRTSLVRPGFRFVQRRVPAALTTQRGGIRLTKPAMTALDQVAHHGGDGIDRALRSRRTTLAAMREALTQTPLRRGNLDRRAMLLDSRDTPWSQAERLAHRLLREAGIGGWSANVRIDCRGAEYIVDIAFRDSPLVIEIDGRDYHGAERFDDDRLRGNELLLVGKQVLRFTWRMLTQHPGMVIATVRRALRLLGRPPRTATQG